MAVFAFPHVLSSQAAREPRLADVLSSEETEYESENNRTEMFYLLFLLGVRVSGLGSYCIIIDEVKRSMCSIFSVGM